MSAIKFELAAEPRQDIGKGASRRLRHSNKVPAVVYGANEPATSLTLDHNAVSNALSHEAFYSHILTLVVDKKSEKVILKDVQRDPSAPRILHMDFLRVRADQKLNMYIPLHFVGDEKAPGLSEGGVIHHAVNEIEISCLPGDLPEFLEVDTSNMKLNDVLHFSDIPLPKGVEIVALAHGAEDHDLPIVSIHKPRIAEEAIVAPSEDTEAEAKPAEGTDASKEK